MSTDRAPGWYADPAGSGQLRYHDGAEWGEELRTVDAAFRTVNRPPLPSRWGGSQAFWLAAALVSALLLPVVAYFLLPHPLPPPEPVAAESSAVATQGPADPATQSSSLEKRCVSTEYLYDTKKPTDETTLYGRGIKGPLPAGWKPTLTGFSNVRDKQGARIVTSNQNHAAEVALGGVARKDPAFASLEQGTQFLVDCTIIYWPDKIRYTELVSEKVTVDGMSGWRRRIHLDYLPRAGSKSLTVEVVLLDTGDDKTYAAMQWETYEDNPAGLKVLDGYWRSIKRYQG